MVGSLGSLWRILQQSGLHLHHEGTLRHRRWLDGPEHRGLAGYHVPAREEAESCHGALRSDGACRCRGRISGRRCHHSAVGVEMGILVAVSMTDPMT